MGAWLDELSLPEASRGVIIEAEPRIEPGGDDERPGLALRGARRREGDRLVRRGLRCDRDQPGDPGRCHRDDGGAPDRRRRDRDRSRAPAMGSPLPESLGGPTVPSTSGSTTSTPSGKRRCPAARPCSSRCTTPSGVYAPVSSSTRSATGGRSTSRSATSLPKRCSAWPPMRSPRPSPRPPNRRHHEPGVRELRLVVTTEDYDAAVGFYRDALGMAVSAEYLSDNQGRVTILQGGVATLETRGSRSRRVRRRRRGRATRRRSRPAGRPGRRRSRCHQRGRRGRRRGDRPTDAHALGLPQRAARSARGTADHALPGRGVLRRQVPGVR